LTAVHLIVLTGVMELVFVGFISFLVKVVRRRSFLETIHWRRQDRFSAGSLVMLGIGLAITVMVASALLPRTAPTPIEKLLSSARALYVFALFGIAVAPLLEEIIFRGFLFKVLSDLTSPTAAAILTAILFGLLHTLQLSGNWGAVALIFVVGYFLALIRKTSGSTIASLIVHASYNATLFGAYAVGVLLQKSVK
jgi:uncharacterized protein